jgi:elongator complex protein 3
LKGSALEKWYYEGRYKPYNKEEVAKLIIEMLKVVPRYCRAMRIMREIPPAFLVAGILNIDLRKDIEEEIRKRGLKIKEIRFREIGFALRDKREIKVGTKIKKTEYRASGGKEIFLEAVNEDDLLFGLLRLRLDKKDSAMVREVHVYGPALELGEQGKISQHKGLGKELMAMAESLAKKNKKKKIQVISGVGVREYYKSLGYVLDKKKVYMEKDI